MFRVIDGLPPNVLAIEAVGKVTHEDYHNTLIPKAEAMMTEGSIRMLYVIGKEFVGFGLRHCGTTASLGSSTGTISAMLQWSPIRRGYALR